MSKPDQRARLTSSGAKGSRRRVLLIGGGAREHAIGEALCRDGRVELYVVAHNPNAGLAALAKGFEKADEKDIETIVRLATGWMIEMAVIGLEDPLAVGLPDALESVGIPTVGPTKLAAQVETSKLFLRELMQRHDIPGAVDYKFVTSSEELETFLVGSDRQYALKPVGLTAGKGVRVMGIQLLTCEDAVAYGKTVIQDRIGGVAGILLEERLEGPEFTLQAFVDGSSVVPMPIVKDYKLAYELECGPNTGSMGSYSEPNGLLHFVSEIDRRQAIHVLESVVAALRQEGIVYKGIMYGQFMQTANGARLVEINARFGDPEGINVLALLESDFLSVCDAICGGTLDRTPIRFASKATVCKYITPPGYPDVPKLNEPIFLDLPAISAVGVKVFFAKVHPKGGHYLTTSSRSIALLGVADTVEAAHQLVERALEFATGGKHHYHVRHDIGTRALIESAVVPRDTSRQRTPPRAFAEA